MSSSIIEHIPFYFYLMINIFSPLPPNYLFLANQGKISIILTPELRDGRGGGALDTLYGCLQVLSTALVN